MDPLLPGTSLRGPVELSNCDREPIHIPATIQAFGCMVVVRMADRRIVSASENVSHWLSDFQPSWLGKTLDQTLPTLGSLLDQVAQAREGKLIRRDELALGESGLTVSAHHCDGLGFFELESRDIGSEGQPADLVGRVFAGLENRELQELYQRMIELIREFTGFDRVMLYQFHEDDHGSVIAEAKCEEQEAYLGLHYPAGDIPVPARRLYELNWIRTLADVHADAIPMLPGRVAVTGDDEADDSLRPINMTYSQLRAISPIHLEYLRNMKVGASMSISILSGGRLWGLVACHHRTPKVLSPSQRDACELAGSVLSTYLTSRRQEAVLKRQVGIRERITSEVSKLANVDDFLTSMENAAPWMSDLLDADGFVYCTGERQIRWGETVDAPRVGEIVAALEQQDRQSVLYTDRISGWIPAAKEYEDRVAGLLVIRMGQRDGGLLLFFRKPYAKTIQWAGDPNKTVTDESGRLSPRKSFEQFTQEVTGTSRPWSATDRETADTLLSTLNSVIVEQAARVQRINRELRQLNADLDAFAYAASHDLKEPLRGIHHYIYLLEEAGTHGDQAFHRSLRGLKQLVERMSDLLDGLLRFSRAGRQDLWWEEFTLQEVVGQAQDILFAGSQPDHVDIQIESAGPLNGDFACIREVLTNLISNAIKYNDQETVEIRIGTQDVRNSPLKAHPELQSNVVYVRDNGIGIEPAHQQQVFEIFRRLHERQEYGGGSGAGLTIVRRIVERHNGRLAVESDGKLGTTIHFGWEPKA
ncbi:GAF domain-containing protein [Roseiconus nitratireducens]|uniref:histidine kinase n=1 Tax=Roseiconus nitratireducens TaxID=2605748 RepID=A0A5M6DAK0_9BACT|nr:ATP-binding protein [Roseiconus nitratireducens]KAA5543019.1 GAF domain-containing protein [Roseiconus nitratireducens]